MNAIEPKRACQQRLSVLNKSHDAARVLKITKTVVPRQHPAKFAGSPKICRPHSWQSHRHLLHRISVGERPAA